MSSLPVPQGGTFVCSLCNQSRTNWARYESRSGLYVCTTCFQPVIQAGRIGGNTGMVHAGINANPNNGNGANQTGYGGGPAEAPSGNFYNAVPSPNLPGNIFGTGSGNVVQQLVDPEQIKKELVSGQ